jgi:hypothetical protein
VKHLLSGFTILVTLVCKAQTIKQGDNLKTEFRKVTQPYYFKAPRFTDWAEGINMLLIGARPNPNDCSFLFIALHDTTLVGVFTTKTPNVFMFDTGGNSILNNTSEFFILPEWTVKNKTKILPTDKTVYNLLDRLYDETLQANDGQPGEKTIETYQQFKTDTTLANRHIALLFDTYQNIINETAPKGEKPPADICVSLMRTLTSECVSVYNSTPAIVWIYMGEALLGAGLTDDAREHFKRALQFYPNSVPLLVYNYRLEQDATKKNEQLMNLKKNYPEHWMVKDL